MKKGTISRHVVSETVKEADDNKDILSAHTKTGTKPRNDNEPTSGHQYRICEHFYKQPD